MEENGQDIAATNDATLMQAKGMVDELRARGVEMNADTQKIRPIFSPKAVRILQAFFNNNNIKPTMTEKRELARKTGLTTNQVTTWFANKRSRDKSRRGDNANNEAPRVVDAGNYYPQRHHPYGPPPPAAGLGLQAPAALGLQAAAALQLALPPLGLPATYPPLNRFNPTAPLNLPFGFPNPGAPPAPQGQFPPPNMF